MRSDVLWAKHYWGPSYFPPLEIGFVEVEFLYAVLNVYFRSVFLDVLDALNSDSTTKRAEFFRHPVHKEYFVSKQTNKQSFPVDIVKALEKKIESREQFNFLTALTIVAADEPCDESHDEPAEKYK